MEVLFKKPIVSKHGRFTKGQTAKLDKKIANAWVKSGVVELVKAEPRQATINPDDANTGATA